MYQTVVVDNAEQVGQLINAGWEWISFSGDGGWLLYTMRRIKKAAKRAIRPEDITVE